MFLGLTLLLSCSKKQAKEAYVPEVLPEHFPSFPYSVENPLSPEGIALGKRLFFDTKLSANEDIACSSCHLKERAYADEVALSDIGISNRVQRNTPTLFNLAWSNSFFWDGGSSSLELQALGPITHFNEMKGDWSKIIKRIAKDKSYKKQFKKAFGSRKVTVQKIAFAIAQFEKSILSYQSKYDKVKQGKVSFTPEEEKGYQLYKNACAGCHSEPLFTDNLFHNNGIESDFFTLDKESPILGRYRITLDSADLGKFRTPSLRNVVLSGPYMHDGRFSFLEEVLYQYSQNIQMSATLDSKIPKEGFGFDDADIKALKTFLNTLTDSTFIQRSDSVNYVLK